MLITMKIHLHGKDGNLLINKRTETMYIFGYGSLVDIEQLAKYLGKNNKFKKNELYICKLKGYKRIWNVSMDNTQEIPNYKYYIEEIENERPNYFVTFLNIEIDPSSEIVGVLFFVDKMMLEKLKIRERNYALIEITNNIDIDIPDKSFIFIAKNSGIRRYKEGLKQKSAVIPKEYYDFVENSYKKLEKNKLKWKIFFQKEYNENFLETYNLSTYKNKNLIVKDLIRINTDKDSKGIVQNSVSITASS